MGNLEPWIFVSGSYSGALVAWTAATSPGTFWVYHASSALVQAIQDLVSAIVTVLLSYLIRRFRHKVMRISAALRQRPRWPVRIHFRLIIANESTAFQSQKPQFYPSL
jgi:hypothetical protein